MEKNEMLDFYKKTSLYTELGLYKEFAEKLPNDIAELSILQRKQIIHPIIIWNNLQEGWWDDLSEVEKDSIIFEDDVLPTAQAMLSELLRRDIIYSINRKVKDKIHVTCRGEAILLASILKAKGISARVRSGFAEYLRHDNVYRDHWITEYYNEQQKRWILVDADNQWGDTKIKFDLNDIPYSEFLFASDAYLKLRQKQIEEEKVVFASEPITIGLPAAIRVLFFDFHCLMNNEIIFQHVPKYIYEKDFDLSEEELNELDNIANLMKEPNKNFKDLRNIWDSNLKFRKISGGLN